MTGKQIVFEHKGQALLEEFAVPQPGAGEIVIENDYTVISAGTERANLIQLPNPVTAKQGFPFYPGYSGAGRVCAIGAGVGDFRIGDRVVVTWGGHRSHTLKPAKDILKIEDSAIDLLDAAFASIAACSFLGVRKLRLELGESAMIAGLGILGMFAVQAAALCGAIPVLALDFDPARRALALKLGAAAAFSPDEKNVIDKIRAATGGGPNAVVEVTGSAAALPQALEYIAWEGRVSLLGCTRVSDTPIDYSKYIHARGISLIGAHTFTRAQSESAPGRWTERDDYKAFLKLVGAGKLQTRSFITEVVSPAESPAVFARLASNESIPLGLVFDWSRIR
jgi:2-desacetyl-2-hydroxyethyl bacteriochlorophyllide A dehydrogenase